MKTIITAVALLAATTMSALAEPATAQLDRTQEYRMWSAEQMVNRLSERFGRTNAACNQPGAEACKGAAIRAYPMLKSILDLAATADDVQWAKIIDVVHEFEAGNEAALKNLEHARVPK